MGNKQGGKFVQGVASEVSQPDPASVASPKSQSSQDGIGFKMNTKMTVDDFDLLAVVGKGAFGKVMQVRKKDTGEIFAMKVLKKQALVKRRQVEHTKTERKVLAGVKHPFVVSLRYAFQSETKLYMILDFFNGGELFHHLQQTGCFPEPRACFYAAQITLAIECLHKNDIVYRDLKPENILLDSDGNLKMTDFGLSKESIDANNLTHTFCGTPEYLAPEVLKKVAYGKPVDWWSLGALLYEMMFGLPPFYSENVQVMYEMILKADPTFPSSASAEARSLISSLLQRDPKKRLGSQNGAQDVKSHAFFNGINWDDIYNKKVVPPFKPTVEKGKLDTSNIDEEFTDEKVKDTFVDPTGLEAVNFQGFTYADQTSPLSQ